MSGVSSSHPGQIDPDTIAHLDKVMGGITRRMWPSSFEGLEHLPADDRYIIVANHSGMGVAELAALMIGWWERFGNAHPVAGMAHPAAFRAPGLRSILQGLGAVEATREGAAYARNAGVPLLLFPGGDHEAARPFWRADRVDWAGRRGWIRLAREHGLAIVPMCITGSHITLPILASGRTVAWMSGLRLAGVRRAPLPLLSLVAAGASAAILGAAGAPLWLAALAMWPSMWSTFLVPWIPAQIGFHFLPAIPAEDVGADPSSEAALYARVVGALQTRMDREREERARSKRASALP